MIQKKIAECINYLILKRLNRSIKMAKIREVIKINSGYTSYVDLGSEFFYYDEEQNRGRMERYMPITAHRLAFEKIANALNPRDRRFYFLSGSYGTGKSHLCLMLGNYFAKQSNSLEMETFFENYETAQREVLLKPGESLNEKPASRLIADRKSGKFLVAICRYGLNLEFEGVVLRAIEEALELEKTNINLDTHYKEAFRRLDDWETKKSEKRFYHDFESVLKQKYSDWTINDIKKGLRQDDETALRVFKQVYREITDTDFSFLKDNLQDILKDLVTDENFIKEYKGIVIIYDEFGYALDEDLVNLNRLHEFTQFCASSGMNHLPIVFIGTGHKPFPNHGKVGDAVHYNTLKDRVSEIALQTEGMEDLIRAIVQQKKSDPIWKQEVSPHTSTFAQLPVDCKILGIFNWLPAPKLKNNIVENIYPMHPLATYALLQMAKDLGSDNRSVFKFFAPEFETGEDEWKNVQKYSYPWFIEKNEILSNGQLKLYTADLLFDYFKDSITTGNRKLLDRIRTSIANYEATLRELNNYIQADDEAKLFSEVDETISRILKVMLVNEITSNETIQIINTEENICFALHATIKSDKGKISNRLETLKKAGILYKNENQIYEFRRSDIKDVRRLVKEFAADPQNHPTNVLEKFLQYIPLRPDEQFLEAKDYNTTYNEDKRLKVRFVMPSALEQTFQLAGQNISFFKKCEAERIEAGFGRNGYAGTAVYVFCDSDEAIEHSKRNLSKNKIERVVVGVRKKPVDIFDAILTLMAVEHIQTSKEAENFGAHENAQLNEIQKITKKYLNDTKEQFFDNKKMDWFGGKGSKLPVNESKRYDSANIMMSNLFKGKRNTFSHSEFNKCHIRNDGIVRRIFLEAGDLLLDLTQNIGVDWTLPENRGGRKYLRNCFVNQQLLKLIHPHADMRYFEIERNIDKFKNVIPVYVSMLDDLAKLKGKDATLCINFFQPYFEEYGQGEIAITLMLLLARRFYGDSIRFKREEYALTDIQFDNTEKVLDLITGKEPNAVLVFEDISDEEKNYFNQIYKIFNETEVEAGKTYGVSDAYKAITFWWQKLPAISKSDQFYNKDLKPFVLLLNSAETKDPFVFVKYDILSLFEITKNEKITHDKLEKIKNKLTGFKNSASEIENTQKQKILDKISVIFEAASKLDIDIQEAIRSWYNDLDSYQKDTFSEYHNNESKIIISKMELTNFRELVFDVYPESLGFGKLSNWSSDYTDDYVQKLKIGKEHIEQNKSPVGDVKIEFENALEEKRGTVRYRGKLKIKIKPEKTDDAIYYTDNSSDPSKENSERKRLVPGEYLPIEQGNRIIKLVVCDGKGHFGKIHTINAIDDTQKHIIQRRQEDIYDTPVNFIFPKDKQGVQVTLESLFREIALVKDKIISVTELEKIITEILKKMKS